MEYRLCNLLRSPSLSGAPLFDCSVNRPGMPNIIAAHSAAPPLTAQPVWHSARKGQRYSGQTDDRALQVVRFVDLEICAAIAAQQTERSPGADVAGVSPVAVQTWPRSKVLPTGGHPTRQTYLS